MADRPVGGEDAAPAGVECGVVLQDPDRRGDGVERGPPGDDLGVPGPERRLQRAPDGGLVLGRQRRARDRPRPAVDDEDDGVALDLGEDLRRLGSGGRRGHGEGGDEEGEETEGGGRRHRRLGG